jgi:site-specific DNA recombinase
VEGGECLTMRTAIYLRVSTDEQVKEGYSLNAQEEKLRAFCYSQDWEIVKIYREEGVSAKNLERPQIKKLLKELSQFDVVLVYKLDRISRSVADINSLLQTFEKNKVSFKSATEPYDTTTSQGKLLINIFASLAQFEREQLAERVFTGMERMVTEGKRAGAAAPFGYDLVDGKLIINPKEAEWVMYIFNAYKTKGKRAIAEELNKRGIKTKQGNYWQDGVVTYVATNPVYCGYIRWNYRKSSGAKTNNEMLVKAEHEPIISKEHFDQVQKIMMNRSGKGYKGTTHYPFTGVLKCNRCGKPLIGGKREKKNGEYRFYRCTGRFNYKICDLPIIPEDVIEKEFFEKLRVEDFIVQGENNNDSNTEMLSEELTKIQSSMERVKKMFKWGHMTEIEYKRDMKELNEKELEITQALENIETPIDLDRVREFLLNLKEHWNKHSFENRKAFIHDIIKTIIIDVTQEASGGPGSRPEITLVDVKVVN